MKRYFYNLATDKSKGFIAGLMKTILFIFSLFYWLIVRILILFYRLKPCRLECRVISVGNITLGGTGKTSLVEFIAVYLKEQGHKVAILSRGYKRKAVSCQLSADSYETMGDEPYMLFKKLGDIPVIVDTNRIRAAKIAIRNYSADTVILDDGFQQWKIKKDLEIVNIDATNPFGNQCMMPRGIMREPLSALKRADMFVLTKTNLKPHIRIDETKVLLNKLNPQAQTIESMHKPLGFYNLDKPDSLLDVDILKGKTVTLFSGIGDPDSFENLIESLGIKIGLYFRFADHHNYSRQDLDNIVRSSKDKNIDTIITTEKDAARLAQLSSVSCQLSALVLRIELRINIKDEQRFYSRLLRIYTA